MFLWQVLDGLLNVLWPPRTRCLLCDGALGGDPQPNRLVCESCSNSMAFPVEPGLRCANCTRPILDESGLCSDCEEGAPFGVVFAVGPHVGPLREAIHHLKFGDRPELAGLLGPRLAARVLVGHDCIVPVPLHPSRQRERGYNQAALLAGELGGALGCPVFDRVLIRRRATGHQAKLDRRTRLRNLQQAFALQGQAPWVGRRVLLVDDVLTTGATASAAAAALHESGARSVDLAVLAVSTTPVKGKRKTSH